MSVWIKAKTIIRTTDKNGRGATFRPGDWFESNRHDARNWLAAGQCEIVNPDAYLKVLPPQSGIVCTQDVGFAYTGLPVTIAPPRIEYEKTLIWNPDIILNTNLLPAGFNLLERWELAVVISDYNLLAENIGTDEDRARTVRIVHDLRIPVYDTRLMFVRKCIATDSLFKLWESEKQGSDERLAFLRALYQVKPYILALPSVWCEK